MSIPMNNVCVSCFMSKRLEQIGKLSSSDEQATQMGKRVLEMYATSPADMDSALLGGLVDAEICKFFSRKFCATVNVGRKECGASHTVRNAVVLCQHISERMRECRSAVVDNKTRID